MEAVKPLLVGVTGGIGAGKSTICRIFSIIKTPIYNSDLRAKWLMENDPDLVNQITNRIGIQSYNKGKINREFLANEVFNDRDKLTRLNDLVHPAVDRDFSTWIQGHLTNPYVIKEAALLFETGTYKKMDFVINVQAGESARIQRILKRDKFRTIVEIQSIIKNQFDDKKRLELANFQIINDDSELVIPQVLKLHEYFLQIRS
ncbi:MAG: dephospho-CoA kinase [Bacteroidetes bacterium]|nr:dephospho-CoA kinase [Bacteroidota bacterium]MDA1118952.1 dephospho-CoA kinase [Bacteroidota bacterium]